MSNITLSGLAALQRLQATNRNEEETTNNASAEDSVNNRELAQVSDEDEPKTSDSNNKTDYTSPTAATFESQTENVSEFDINNSDSESHPLADNSNGQDADDSELIHDIMTPKSNIDESYQLLEPSSGLRNRRGLVQEESTTIVTTHDEADHDSKTEDEPVDSAGHSKPTSSLVHHSTDSVKSESPRVHFNMQDTTFDEPPVTEEPADERTCRICFCGPEEGRLISPCMCKGTMKYVHLDCLQHWRAASANSKSYFQCDTCHYKYHFRRTTYAKILGSWVVHQLLTLLVLIALVFFSGFIGKLFVIVWHGADDEDVHDVIEYGGWMSWFFFDIYSAHWVLGAIVVGVGGFAGLLGFGGLHGPGVWVYDGRRNGGAILLIVVVIGLMTAFYSLYIVVRDVSKRALIGLEEHIIEVQNDENAQTYVGSENKDI